MYSTGDFIIMADNDFIGADNDCNVENPNCVTVESILEVFLWKSTWNILQNKGEKLHMGDVGIIWPGNQMSKPKGIKISTHLKVVTIQALPFIYVDRVPAGGVCDTELNRMPCPRPNSTGG